MIILLLPGFSLLAMPPLLIPGPRRKQADHIWPKSKGKPISLEKERGPGCCNLPILRVVGKPAQPWPGWQKVGMPGQNKWDSQLEFIWSHQLVTFSQAWVDPFQLKHSCQVSSGPPNQTYSLGHQHNKKSCWKFKHGNSFPAKIIYQKTT